MKTQILQTVAALALITTSATAQDNPMVNHTASYIAMPAAEGQTGAFAEFLAGAAAIVRDTEPGTVLWFALQADDMLDLDPEEMGEVSVKLYYDPATDQLIMAVDLRADDIIDLDVTEFQEIPVNLSYVFLSDPKLLAEALRANDIIDLEVEDLGEIPIRLHIESGSTGVGSQGAETDAANSAK